ncbi:MAG TPA: hypothetical protein PKK10_17055, partial [Woeseiaceae bacterium]|nr:hypothetical protein [Woeseiaceae bacterium]
CNAPGADAAGTSGAKNSPQSRAARLSIAGTLQDKDIDEASGMAWSARSDELLWLQNDSGGKARLYAIDLAGKSRGRLKLDDVKNKDWEDLASFVLDGEPWLLVADIGDNSSKRPHVSLYVVAEPDLAMDKKQTAKPAWTINFSYEDGPRDAEAVAVDSERNRVLIVSKRDIPAHIYEVPLQPANDAPVVAHRLGVLTSIPQPKEEDVRFAPVTNDWHWQATAMDIARDGSALIVMTYGAVYYFARDSSNDWATTLGKAPLAFGLKNIRNAEAAAIRADGQQIFVSVEQKRAPLLRIDLAPVNNMNNPNLAN